MARSTSSSRDREPEEGVPGPGEVLGGKYKVERILAVGGMGAVLSAIDITKNQTVAVKVMLPAAMEVDGAVTRFQREAQAASKIVSDHVVHISDVGTLDSGAPFMVMEYLAGDDLGDIVGDGKVLPVHEAVDYVLQACEAMAEAHKLGIVHRDLKPSNLFLTRRPNGTACVKVLDFGISKFTGSDVFAAGEGSLTATRAMMGSPLYMSPEQVRSAKNVDRRTDIWSLGIILFELVTGRLPFEADTAGAICAMIAADDPVPMRWMNKDLPEALERIVLHCLEKEPAARYQDVAELADALRPYATASGIVAADRAAKTMEDASLMPTLHAAPIKLDLGARSAPAARTLIADEPVASSKAVMAPLSTSPPPRLPMKKRGSGVALVFLLGVTAWGGWHFRERLRGAASPYFEASSATGIDTSDAGAVSSTSDDAATPLLTSASDLDAASVEDAAPTIVDAGELLDAMAAADADDGGDEEEDEEEDAAVAALTFADAGKIKPAPRPYHPKVPTRRKKKRPRPRL
jgi:serine/threonine-protein kinase